MGISREPIVSTADQLSPNTTTTTTTTNTLNTTNIEPVSLPVPEELPYAEERLVEKKRKRSDDTGSNESEDKEGNESEGESEGISQRPKRVVHKRVREIDQDDSNSNSQVLSLQRTLLTLVSTQVKLSLIPFSR